MKQALLFTLLIVLVTTSCSVRKRSYRKGYYLEWAHNKHPKNDLAKNPNKEKEKCSTANKESGAASDNNEKLLAQVGKKNEPKLPDDVEFKNPLLDLAADTCGDVILMKNGDRLVAKVIEINEGVVKYKRCDNLSGPTYSTNKSMIHSIKYTNGFTEVMPADEVKTNTNTYNTYNPSKPTNQYKKLKTHPKAQNSLYAAIVSGATLFLTYFLFIIAITSGAAVSPFLLVLLVASLLLAILSLSLAKSAGIEIKAKPDKFKGKGTLIPARIVSWIVIGIILFVGFIIFLITL